MKKLVLISLIGLALPGIALAGVGGETVTPLVMTLPFAILLSGIALGPTIGPRWWGRYYAFFCFALAAIVVIAYLGYPAGVQGLRTALSDYASFMALIGALFVISSGIWIKINRSATPFRNVLLLLSGAILANLLGTTGASILLIRPYLSMNRGRLRGYHLAFFIFLVSNIGGLLTPIGDPPLFLGYLKGIPFFWVFKAVWPIWLLAITFLLVLFFIIDSRNEQKDAPASPVEGAGPTIEIIGGRQFVLLGVTIGAVFLESPWREALMAAMAALSYLAASQEAHRGNQFTFAPLQEVAILFFAIFITMAPALEWLLAHASQLGLSRPGDFFWGSGVLSSVLDNAPTYLNFFTTVSGLYPGLSMETFLASHGLFIQAISVGSVFFGANTYIGNGPNFMVKSVAEQYQVASPSFLEYIVRYAFPILTPLYLLIWLFFFRGV